MIRDLPVMVALPAPLDAQVAAWVERDLGWQVVDGDGPLAPVVALTDGDGPRAPVVALTAGDGPLPWIAVTDGAPDGEQVRRHLTAGARDVVGWPHERARLQAAVAQVVAGVDVGVARPRLTVAGAAGGAGASTVALAIGGLLAWAGATVLVAGSADVVALACARAMEVGWRGRAASTPGGGFARGDGPASGGRDAPAASLAGDGDVAPGDALAATGVPRDGGAAPVAVPGVDGLSVVHGVTDAVAAAWDGDLVVVDAGTALSDEVTLVVSRPDRTLLRARAAVRPVVVVGDGALGSRDCRALLGSALLAQLPSSARVARAGLLGRVPTALPGAWLRTLRAGLGQLGVGR